MILLGQSPAGRLLRREPSDCQSPAERVLRREPSDCQNPAERLLRRESSDRTVGQRHRGARLPRLTAC